MYASLAQLKAMVLAIVVPSAHEVSSAAFPQTTGGISSAEP